MKLRELMNSKFNGEVALIAKALNSSRAQVHNYLANGIEVLELKNGDFIIETKQSKIIKTRI